MTFSWNPPRFRIGLVIRGNFVANDDPETAVADSLMPALTGGRSVKKPLNAIWENPRIRPQSWSPHRLTNLTAQRKETSSS